VRVPPRLESVAVFISRGGHALIVARRAVQKANTGAGLG
jgi:hypothetical protein